MPNIFTSSSPVPRSSALPRKVSPLGHAFSAYLFMPDGVCFETQEPNETIILMIRKHWITNLSWLIVAAIIIIIPLILFPAVIIVGFSGIQIPSSLTSFLILSWYLLIFSYILVNFLLWYFTVSIVTSERIIDIDFINLLNKKFAETRIARVEDVTMRTGGFIPSFFNYGNVYIQTAAKDAVFQFEAVPRPDQVVKIINQLMGKKEEE